MTTPPGALGAPALERPCTCLCPLLGATADDFYMFGDPAIDATIGVSPLFKADADKRRICCAESGVDSNLDKSSCSTRALAT